MGFFDFDLAFGFPWGHLDVMSQILGSGARREAKEMETEAGKRMAKFGSKNGGGQEKNHQNIIICHELNNPRSYRTIK